MKNIRKNMVLLNLNENKEFAVYFLCVVLFIGLGVGLFILRGQILFLLFPVLGLLVFTYFYFSRYEMMLRKIAFQDEEEFVSLFTFFQVYLNDGFNVYNALQSIIPYASDSVRVHLEKLVNDIENDKTVTPYIEFADHFNDIQINQVMLSVYQMVDQGTNEVYLRQFRQIYGRLSDQKHELGKQKKIERVSSLSALPLIGSGVSMVMLLTALVEIMGGVMNGL